MSRKPLAPKPAPLARPQGKVKFFAAVAPALVGGKIIWDQFDEMAAAEAAAISGARSMRPDRPPSKHGY